MDNLTHSLVGYTIAKVAKHSNNETLVRAFKDKKNALFLVLVSIFAANFPDLDLLYSLFDSSPLGYLVHHRGHTHTFIYAIPQTLLAVGLFGLFFRIKDKAVWFVGLILALVNICLHIALDSLNIYGVHPFYPWDNQWYYGDRVFIIEPWIWFSLLPIALTPFRRLFGRKTFFTILFIAIIGFAFKFEMMVLGTSLLLVTYFLGLLFIYSKINESTKALTSVALTLVVLLGFMIEGVRTERFLKHYFGDSSSYHQNTGEKLIEYAITPYPGNPFCWDVYVVRTDSQDGYYVGVGKFQSTNVPGFSCPSGLKQKTLQQRSEISAITSMDMSHLKDIPYVVWFEDYRGSKSALFDDKNDCRLKAWFQFVRLPYFTKEGRYIDLRFSQTSDRQNFTELNLKTYDHSCVLWPAPWVSPRQDLLKK